MYKTLKWLWLVLIVTAIPFVALSCSDDKDDDESSDSDYAEMIIGIWSDEGHDNWYDGGGIDAGDAYGYEFKNNGVCYVHGSCYGAGRYQIFDDRLIITFYNNADDESYTNTYYITKLTKSILVLQDNEYYDEEEYYRVN